MVPAGGLAPDSDHWIACCKGLFLSVRVLSRVFHGQFIAGLKQAFARGELHFHGSLAEQLHTKTFELLLDQAVRHD